MFEVQQVRHGKVIAKVGSRYATREEAERQCEECARADWNRYGVITPTTQYEVVEAMTYEIWIKNDPERVDGFVGDTRCTIRSRDGEWTPMDHCTDLQLVEWNLRDFVKCNPKIANHYEIREVPYVR